MERVLGNTNSYLEGWQVRERTVENGTSDETESELRWDLPLKTGSSRLLIKRRAPETARPGQPREPFEICFPNSAARRGNVGCTFFAPAKKSQNVLAAVQTHAAQMSTNYATRGQSFDRVSWVISVEHTLASVG
jgi:hypothetical protein